MEPKPGEIFGTLNRYGFIPINLQQTQNPHKIEAPVVLDCGNYLHLAHKPRPNAYRHDWFWVIPCDYRNPDNDVYLAAILTLYFLENPGYSIIDIQGPTLLRQFSSMEAKFTTRRDLSKLLKKF